MDGEEVQKPPLISEKLLAIDGFWERKSEFSSGMEALIGDLYDTSIDGPTSAHTGSTSRLHGLSEKSTRIWEGMGVDLIKHIKCMYEIFKQ